MTRLSDDAILGLLETSLTQRQHEPDHAALVHLRSALAAHEDTATLTVLRHRPFSPRRLAHKPLAAALATVIVVSGGAAAAVGTGSLPPMLNRVAYNLGLPVTDPALVNARDAIATLSDAIDARDPAAVIAGLGALRAALPALNVAELAELDPAISAVTARAEQFLASLHHTDDPHDGKRGTRDQDGTSSVPTQTRSSGSDDGSSSPGGTRATGDGDDQSGGTTPTTISGDTSGGGTSGSTDGGSGGTSTTDGGSGSSSSTTDGGATTSGSGDSGSGSNTASTNSSDGGSSTDGDGSSGTSTSGGG